MAKAGGNDTPLMQQHKAIKAKYPDAILLFRVGDFYETFGADAITTSQILGITLTKRNNGNAASLELAGFPHHALDTYLHKLVKAGYRVAICDQLEDPKQVKGIVKRGVTELVTAGTATNEKLLDHQSNNYLAAIYIEKNEAGISFLDVSTGEFLIATGSLAYIDNLLQAFKPAEIIFSKPQQQLFKTQFGSTFASYALDEWIFENTYTYELLTKQLGTQSLKGFGIDEAEQNNTLAVVAAGAILHYLKDTEHLLSGHITRLQKIIQDDYLWMDKFTIKNLDLVSEQNGLFHILNNTITPMGARMLKRWLLMPLQQQAKIEDRLQTVAYFIKEVDERNKLLQLLKPIGDLERLTAKIPLRKIMPREMVQIGKALQNIALIKQIGLQSSNPVFKRLADTLNENSYLSTRIISSIFDPAPAQINKGFVIAAGKHEELDHLRNLVTNSKQVLLNLQNQEIQNTGINSIKIGFNNVFGYYLEVTNIHKSKVPETWIRKQTLANAERYITPELKELEAQILGAEEKIIAIESNYYQNLITELDDYVASLQTNAHIIATLDALTSFATIAVKNNYYQPTLHAGFELSVKESRHPIIEKKLPIGEAYISNDVFFNNTEQQFIILTGPNMSGKSALLRQLALITIMAHAGSFVPAKEALIPITDKIFTRVGASDNLAAGESTFMVEMQETASIINTFTKKSLLLLDEIGRGTATYDGISIAWSIVEYLQQHADAPKTIFATHYHELNELENKFSTLKNYHITSKEINNKIIFLRKLAQGGSTHSFGIQVAKMAGMPPSLTGRAYELLQQLEEKHQQPTNNGLQETFKKFTEPKVQLSIFDEHSVIFDEIRNILKNIDINRLTPVEALLKLQEIKHLLR